MISLTIRFYVYLISLLNYNGDSCKPFKNKPISVRSQAALTKQNKLAELSHEKLSNVRRWSIFAVSLTLLILGLCGIFSPTKQAITSAFNSVLSQPQTVTRYETKNIEDIREGDYVLATDPDTGETVKCKVTQVFVNRADGIHRLTIASGHSQQIFGVTAEHPYFVVPNNDDLSWDDLLSRAVAFSDSSEDEPENIFFITDKAGNEHAGCYVATKNLRNGDLLIGPSGELSHVIGNDYEPHPEGITTYNFEVEHGHNYFVLAQHDMTTSGSPPVLVHNMCAVNSNTTPKGRILSQHALNDSLARHNIPYGQIKKYIDNVIDECTEVVDQGLNTKAYIKKGVDGKSRYSLVVFNEEKNMIVTALRDLTKGQLNNILSNHRHF